MKSKAFQIKTISVLLFMTVLECLTYALCQAQQENKLKTFDKSISLERIDIPDFSEYVPASLGILDNYLVLIDKYKSPQINFFSLRDLSLVGSYGNKGQGPGEFKTPFYHGQFEKKGGRIYYWLHDMARNRLVKLDLEKSLKDIAYEYETLTVLPPDIYIPLSIYQTSNKTLVGTSNSGNGRWFVYNQIDKTLLWQENFPEVSQVPTEPIKKGMLYYGAISGSSDLTRFVNITRFFRRLDFFNDSGKLLNSTVFDTKGKPEPNFSNPNIFLPPGTMYYYFDIQSTDNYIYVLNYDKPMEQEDTLNQVKIDVFDWQGNPVVQFVLNEHLMNFAVDEIGGKIYGISNRVEDKPIVAFDFKGLLK